MDTTTTTRPARCRKMEPTTYRHTDAMAPERYTGHIRASR